ncbi:hypothetical protein WIS52_23215 [Pseudonocardia nematodicida]|uniref:Uncharacterized protein n=1 Tax=Pseudonocardia nematodicida TaxID=1206997 RepID=A0ABV1KG05_9PSEU
MSAPHQHTVIWSKPAPRRHARPAPTRAGLRAIAGTAVLVVLLGSTAQLGYEAGRRDAVASTPVAATALVQRPGGAAGGDDGTVGAHGLKPCPYGTEIPADPGEPTRNAATGEICGWDG